MICHSLMASETHRIPLFSEKLVKKLDKWISCFLLKVLLLPCVTWLDHSVLQRLVQSSQNLAAKNILEDFISSIDYSVLITSYSIASPSQLMIPTDGSDYILVATQCDFEFESLVLKKVVAVRDVLIEQWQITPHAIQLTAVHIQEKLLYWMVPKSVAGLIADRTPSIQYNLWKNNIVMSTIFPVDTFSNKTVIKFGPFSLLNSTKVRNVVVMCSYCVHAILKKKKNSIAKMLDFIAGNSKEIFIMRL